jgi:hypothetical protein
MPISGVKRMFLTAYLELQVSLVSGLKKKMVSKQCLPKVTTI